MKALAFVSIFICLLNIAVGLKCYKCDDTNYYYNMLPDDVDMSCGQLNKTTTCHRSSKFCVTYKFKDCEYSDVCFEHDCDWLEPCKSVGSHKTVHPILAQPVEVTCCQGDLCNSPDKSENINLPSSHNKLSNKIYLFRALFSSFLYSVFVRFCI